MKKLLIMFLFIQSANGTVLVRGNAAAALNPTGATGPSNPNAQLLTFSQPINAQAFDRTNGVLYVGLANNAVATPPITPLTIAPANNYTLSRVVRTPGISTPTFIPIANNSTYFPTPLVNGIDFLALATAPGDLSPNLAIVQTNIASGVSYYLQNSNIIVSSATGSKVQGYTGISAYDPTLGKNGSTSDGIVQIAANKNFIFAAVRPYGSTTAPVDFGAPTATPTNIGSGIAVLGINPTTLFPYQLAAQPNDPGIKAARLDDTTPQVVIQGTPLFVPNRASLYWDDQLQRLYIGLQFATALMSTGTDGDGAQSVVVANVSSSGSLSYQNFISGSLATMLPPGDDQYITAVTQVVGEPQNLAATQLKVMHSSGGGSYLIVHGGNGTITNNAFGVESSSQAAPTPPASFTIDGTIGNMIFALPLVDVHNPANPVQGTLAAPSSFNTTSRSFTTPAASLLDLTTSTTLAALVGAGPLPVQASTSISGAGGGIQLIPSGSTVPTSLILGANTMDVSVVGDTVYVALSNLQTSTLDDTGVYYSQAMFDEKGKIKQWTPWSKRALPFDAFPQLGMENNAVRFVDIDAVTGKVWAVNGGEFMQAVVTTNWDSGQFLSPLPQVVNAALPTGCFSVLDLDQYAQGLGAVTAERYALFGGINAVCFAITTSSTLPAAPFNLTANDVPASQDPIVNYVENVNFLVTKLPLKQAVSVEVLEYSRQVTGSASNYFFAGTDQGLYVFAGPSGNGFDVATLSTFNNPPFAGGSWQLISNIPGSIIDIKTTGNSLYILAMQPQKMGMATTTLYSVVYTTNVASMFASPTIIAQTGSGVLGDTLYFYGIQIISTADNGSTEQIVLATNNGLFMSNASGGVQAATTQANAAWAPISPDSSKTQYYGGIAGIDTPVPNTVWPLSLQDPTGQGIYNRGTVFQLSGSSSAPFTFDPVPFNANVATPPFVTFDPISYFWSDGARRFFILSREQQCSDIYNRIMSLPYNVTEWNVIAPTVLADAVLDETSQLFWIKNIGATGIIMAGTNRGVIALE